MGEAYRQQFRTTSKTFRAAVWAARVEGLIGFVAVMAVGVVEAGGLPGMTTDFLLALFLLPVIILLANSTILQYFLLPLQWFGDDNWVLENGARLKMAALILTASALFYLVLGIIPGWNGKLVAPAGIHVFLSLGLAIYRYVKLHEQAANDGPADWAIAAARRIAEKD